MSNRKALSPRNGEDEKKQWTTWYMQHARKMRQKREQREQEG